MKEIIGFITISLGVVVAIAVSAVLPIIVHIVSTYYEKSKNVSENISVKISHIEPEKTKQVIIGQPASARHVSIQNLKTYKYAVEHISLEQQQLVDSERSFTGGPPTTRLIRSRIITRTDRYRIAENTDTLVKVVTTLTENGDQIIRFYATLDPLISKDVPIRLMMSKDYHTNGLYVDGKLFRPHRSLRQRWAYFRRWVHAKIFAAKKAQKDG
jgi:uncharacterized membrane protein YgaE (UPF0421/DUF939 family)